ncbi:unnamed protein product, partial [Sphacelaria rigidula]
MSAVVSTSQAQKRKNYSDFEREEVIRHLLAGSKDGVRKRGACQAAAEKFGCYWETSKRLWIKYDQQRKAGISTPQQATGHRGKCGWK